MTFFLLLLSISFLVATTGLLPDESNKITLLVIFITVKISPVQSQDTCDKGMCFLVCKRILEQFSGRCCNWEVLFLILPFYLLSSSQNKSSRLDRLGLPLLSSSSSSCSSIPYISRNLLALCCNPSALILCNLTTFSISSTRL